MFDGLPIPPALAALFLLSTAIAGVSVVFVAKFRPLVEALPFARPNAPLHDLALQGASFLINLLLLWLAAVLTNNLPSPWGFAVAALIFVSLIQTFAGDAGYTTLKNVWKANAIKAAPTAENYSSIMDDISNRVKVEADSSPEGLPTLSAEPPAPAAPAQ